MIIKDYFWSIFNLPRYKTLLFKTVIYISALFSDTYKNGEKSLYFRDLTKMGRFGLNTPHKSALFSRKPKNGGFWSAFWAAILPLFFWLFLISPLFPTT